MWWMAYVGASQDVPVRWALNYDRIGLIKPEVSGDPLPIPPSDPLWACAPREWRDTPLGTWIPGRGDTNLHWEIDFKSTSAFGNHPGVTVVGPARLRYFWGDCDPNRWQEPFVFERMLERMSDPDSKAWIEWNPWKFVRDGRLFLPQVFGNAEPIEGYP